jgi:membrane fusion protein (multidrug efflux system)
MRNEALSPRILRPLVGIGALLILLTWLSLVVSGCGSGGDGTESAAADSAAATPRDSSSTDEGDSAKQERTTTVNATVVARGDLVVPVVAEGTIRALHSAEIKTEISGRIVRLSATNGQRVRKGHVILRLDSREYEVAAEEARSKYYQALSVLAVEEDSTDVIGRSTDLQAQISELEELEKRGVITREERLKRETSLDLEELRRGAFRTDMAATRSGVTAARAALERAHLNLERTEIRAPFDGVVSGLELTEGEQMMAGQAVCALVDDMELEAVVGVLEADIGHVEAGRPALLAIPALDDTFRVSVDVVSPQFERTSRTCDVRLRLPDTAGRVKPGMFVRAVIAGETLGNRLLVPREAILTRDARPLLFKVEDDRAVWLYVGLGRQNDDVVEIQQVLQGGTLAEGDLVVVSNHLTLSHDAKVKVKDTLPLSDPWSSGRD